MEGLLLTYTLDAEHRFIKLAVSAIEHIVERFSASGEINIQIIEQIVDFMRSYADQCHHGKEEDLLFPALIELGVPEQGCPLALKRRAHQRPVLCGESHRRVGIGQGQRRTRLRAN